MSKATALVSIEQENTAIIIVHVGVVTFMIYRNFRSLAVAAAERLRLSINFNGYAYKSLADHVLADGSAHHWTTFARSNTPGANNRLPATIRLIHEQEQQQCHQDA
jgi:hypothetical protein